MNEKDSNVGTLRVYEVSALFVPELEGSELSQTIEALKTKLSGLGTIISEGSPVHIKLAYTVEKHVNNKIRRADFANFYWVKFETEATNVAVIEKYLKLDLAETVLRYLFIKAPRENTVLTELSEVSASSVRDEELINEVIEGGLKEEESSEGVITDLGGETPLETPNTEEK